MAPTMSRAARDVLNERVRQYKEEGFTERGDDAYDQGTLASAATCYGMYAADMLHPMSQGDGYAALEGKPPINWPWRAEWWKPKNPRDALVKAAAMLIAEIESLDRKQPFSGLVGSNEVGDSTRMNGIDLIPEMTDPLGKHWEQPNRQMIFIRDGEAHVDQESFKQLKQYDSSFPSGVYPGKMWKRINSGVAYLCWYGEEVNQKCTLHHMVLKVA